MPALTAPTMLACALLVLAGAQKLVDPTMTVGALRALHLPSSPALVRLGSAAELALGLVALVTGSPWAWWAMAASYLAFAAFVVAALRSGTMIGSCGCFGREETPPHWSHVALNGALAAVSALAALAAQGAPVDALADHPGQAAIVVALDALSLALLYVTFVELPRVLQNVQQAAEARAASSSP